MSDNTDDMNDLVLLAIALEEAVSKVKELEAKLRKSALQELSALGQASDAYQAQLAAEAKLARAVEALTQLVIEYDEVDLAYDEPKSMTSAVNVARLITTELKGETDE